MTGEPYRILLVEDNSADVYLLRKALGSAGLDFELTVIEDGGAALAFARGEGAAPDLAIIDLSLPKNDGIQVVEAFRAAARCAAMPVIVMSSSLQPPARLRQEQLRVTRYIPKPPGLEEFLQIGVVIRELLESPAGKRRRVT
jgi:CheY-like chemotaxis protein